MAKIYAPNTEYNGISASVKFESGVGETTNPHLIQWFKSKGYRVEVVIETDESVIETAKSVTEVDKSLTEKKPKRKGR